MRRSTHESRRCRCPGRRALAPESVSGPVRTGEMEFTAARAARDASCARPRAHSRRAARTQPARRAASCSMPRVSRSPRATTAAPAARTPRPRPWPRRATDARGATAVVTLEPCNHTGRTGPCAEAMVEAGVARVVFAQPDPNPVAAGGEATLRAAGVEVAFGLMEREARALNRAWTFGMEHHRPVRHLEVRRHAGRPQRRRRRHQPLGHLQGGSGRRPPAARAVRRDARRHRHRGGRRPASSPCATSTTSRWPTSRCVR